MPQPRQRHVLHVITGLGAGGAEGMLSRLALRLHGLGWSQSVVSLQGGGPAAISMEVAGIPILDTAPLLWPRAILSSMSVLQAIRRTPKDLVQGWMYHGNLAALMARSRVPVVWGIRQCVYDLRNEKPALRAVIRAGALGSRWASHTLYNSDLSRIQHGALGYYLDRSSVVPNGFDVDALAPNDAARRAARRVLDVEDGQIVLGLVGRYHPVKGHGIFLRALSAIVSRHDAVAVLVGLGTDPSNEALQAEIGRLGLTGRVRLLGLRPDVAAITQAFDIACCASLSEAFPNVIGEAMAAAIPVVASDVGEMRYLVGEAGILVPPGDDRALAGAVLDLIGAPATVRGTMGRAGRARVATLFSLDRVAQRYHDLYLSMLATRQSTSHTNTPGTKA